MKSNFLVSATTLLSLCLYPLQFVYAAGNYTFNSIVISRMTITTISGLSTAILSNPEWTGNTAITSTLVGSNSRVTTTLPVLYGCSLCGGDEHGLVIWGLVAESRRSSAIYELPGLPTFTLGVSGQPVSIIMSTSLAPSTTTYRTDSIVSTASSVSLSPLVTSIVSDTPAYSDLTRISSLASSSTSLSSTSFQSPSNTRSNLEFEISTGLGQSQINTTLWATTSFVKPSGSSLISSNTQKQTTSTSSLDDRTVTSALLSSYPYYNMTLRSQNASRIASRCDACKIRWSNADLFYWPDATANDSSISLTSPQALPTSDGIPPSSTAIPDADYSVESTLYGVPASVTQLQGFRGSNGTVVGSDGFTYTFPSAYVVFYDVIASDGCGARGSTRKALTFAFAPEELSTVDAGMGLTFPTMSFAFANLPCPPESVMESYRSHFGPSKSYGPVLAVPQKLLESSEDFTGCGDHFARFAMLPALAITPVLSLDPATITASTPMGVTAGLAPQTVPGTASASTLNRIPSTSQHTQKQTAIGSQVTQPAKTQSQQAQKQNPSPQSLKSAVDSSAGHPSAYYLPVESSSTQNQPGQGLSPQGIPAQNQNGPTQNSNLPISDPPARNPPTQDLPAHGQGQPTQKKPTENQKLPAQLPSTQVDPGFSTVVAWVQAVVVQSQTIVQGAPGVLISGATVKYSANSIYVGNNAAPISAAPRPQPPQRKGPDAAVIGGLSFTPVQQDVSRATNLPAVVVSGQILTNNGPAATINGQHVAYSSGSIHVGTSVAAAPTTASQKQQELPLQTAIIGGLTVVPIPHGSHAATGKPEVIVQGQTLKEDSSAITINGNLVAYFSGSVHVGTNAAPAPTFTSQHTPESPPPQVLEGFTFTPLMLPGSQSSAAPVTVGGQTVSFGNHGARIGTNSILPGAAPITIFGTPVSLGSGGLVIGSQTYATSGWSTNYEAGSNLAMVAGQEISVGPTGAIMIGSTTLTPGGSPITVSGTPLSLGVAGLVVGSRTVPLPSTPIQSIFNIGGTTFTANPTGFSIATTAISKGGPAVTIAGTPISLGSSALIIGSSTVPLGTPSFQSIFTVGGTTFTANPTAFPIAGTTLSANGLAITISGTPISLGPSSLVIGTSTFALNGPAATTTADLGGLILQGLGPVGSSPTSTPTSKLFAGSAVSMTRAPGWALSVWGITAACMLFAALAL